MAAANTNTTYPIDNQEYFYLNIYLKETYKGLGQYEVISNNEIIGQLTSITFTQTTLEPYPMPESFTINISGITKSRLQDVVGYDGKFKVGVNGVINITNEFIEYGIDNIKYKTFNDGLTVYEILNKPSNEIEPQNIIGNNHSVFVDIKKTLNAMVIDRSNISVYDYMNKINNCDELADLLDIF